MKNIVKLTVNENSLAKALRAGCSVDSLLFSTYEANGKCVQTIVPVISLVQSCRTGAVVTATAGRPLDGYGFASGARKSETVLSGIYVYIPRDREMPCGRVSVVNRLFDIFDVYDGITHGRMDMSVQSAVLYDGEFPTRVIPCEDGGVVRVFWKSERAKEVYASGSLLRSAMEALNAFTVEFATAITLVGRVSPESAAKRAARMVALMDDEETQRAAVVLMSSAPLMAPIVAQAFFAALLSTKGYIGTRSAEREQALANAGVFRDVMMSAAMSAGCPSEAAYAKAVSAHLCSICDDKMLATYSLVCRHIAEAGQAHIHG